LRQLQEHSARPDIWQNPEEAQKILKEQSQIQNSLQCWYNLEKRSEDLDQLLQLAKQESDESLLPDIKSDLSRLEQELEQFRYQTLLSGEHDQRNAIVSIHPGAGGTESQDWAQMLLRMYLRWVERNSFRAQIVDQLPGEEAGIKSVTFEVTGDYAYGFLKGESGIHRLVRISPFDANKRRHTSFAAVFVLPEIDDSIDLHIDPVELRIDVFRSSGAGGQHVNVTDSAVRITHLPTGIVAQCQNERSQHRNKDTAMKVLRARIYEQRRKEQQEKRKTMEVPKKEIAWGNQIRSYVFQPYQLVKDHRTQLELGNVGAVMDGDITPFIEAYLKCKE